MISADTDVSIISMSGAFPGAPDIATLWQELLAGHCGIRTFTREESLSERAAASWIDRPNYVPVKGYLEGAEMFDAGHFGISRADAELLDPQHRLFLEHCWLALETAGYGREARRDLRVGVYGASGLSTYLLEVLMNRDQDWDPIHAYQALLGNDKDYLPSRVSYKLDLTGPAVAVQTACSSSLVAVHLACQAILSGECDLALAGGVSVTYPLKGGHLFNPDMIMSANGRCVPFDARADGTVAGNGVGVVLLKNHRQSVVDGDFIEAVIKGTAVNNDGARKAGYTAPSVDQQAAVIVEAVSASGVEARRIHYIEAHGTGTKLGDPIEISALEQAFRVLDPDRESRPYLGSLKANLGHLNAAAGVVGLIKAALVAKTGKIPPNPYLDQLNPDANFDQTRFQVVREGTPYPISEFPRLASVSSFGIGGTNAHAVVGSFERALSAPRAGENVLLVFSAQSAAALDASLRSYARIAPDFAAADLRNHSFTLLVGRTQFPHRAFIVAASQREATDQIASLLEKRASAIAPRTKDRKTLWLFGDMDFDFCEPHIAQCCAHARFRKYWDRVVQISQELGSNDLVAGRVRHFAYQYAIAQTLDALGIRAVGAIGYGSGGLTAKCVAGTISLEGAIMAMTTHDKHRTASDFKFALVSRNAAAEAQMLGVMDSDGQHVAPMGLPSSRDRAGDVELRAWLRNRLEEAAAAGYTDIISIGRVNPDPADLGSKLSALHVHGLDAGTTPDRAALGLIGQVWADSGAMFDWRALFEGERHLRIPLPCALNRTQYSMTRRPVESAPHGTRSIHAPECTTDGNGGSTAPFLPSSGTDTARHHMDTVLLTAMSSVLGAKELSIHDNFFALGGDSLTAAMFFSQLREQMGLDLPARTLFDHPTVAGLADHVIALIRSWPEEKVTALKFNES